MNVRREFKCDLCNSEIRNLSEGIGIRWEFQAIKSVLKSVLIHDSEHHLCGKCCADLKAMFADLDRIQAIRVQMDTAP